jgi:hypothetical protein
VREASRPAYNNLIKPISQLDENRLLRRKLRLLAAQIATRDEATSSTLTSDTAATNSTDVSRAPTATRYDDTHDKTYDVCHL